MKIITKSNKYELYSKEINSLEKSEIFERIGIIPKILNATLNLYVDNFLYYFKKADEIVCIKDCNEDKEIICLKLIHTKYQNTLKIIGVVIPNINNCINLELVDIGKLNFDFQNNELDKILIDYPFLLSSI